MATRAPSSDILPLRGGSAASGARPGVPADMAMAPRPPSAPPSGTPLATGEPALAQALAARIVGFVGTLRVNGFKLGQAEQADALRIAELVGVTRRAPLAEAWRSLLAADRTQWTRFDELFDAYWRQPNATRLVAARTRGGLPAAAIDRGAPPPSTRAPDGGRVRALEAAPDDDAANDAQDAPRADLAGGGASAASAHAQADLAEVFAPGLQHALDAAAAEYARRLRRLLLRRQRPSAQGERVDLRRTLRRSVARGGTPIDLALRARRSTPPRLVLLLDVSRSMNPYGFFFLRFARALRQALQDVRVYAYHTHLLRIDEALADPDPWRAEERLQLLAEGWAGGTRIGACLAEFNAQHAARAVHARTVVVVVSDGYDTGAPELLAHELAALRRRARRVVWLNPLLGRPGYRPVARGMQAALPHLDLFASARDLASLEALLPRLAAI